MESEPSTESIGEELLSLEYTQFSVIEIYTSGKLACKNIIMFVYIF